VAGYTGVLLTDKSGTGMSWAIRGVCMGKHYGWKDPAFWSLF